MSRGWGRVQRAIFDWFVARPRGTVIGTVDLAANIGSSRESVFRALLRLEDDGWVYGVAERHGGLGRHHQRRWAMRDERLLERARYLKAVERGRELMAARRAMPRLRHPRYGGDWTGTRLPRTAADWDDPSDIKL
jgi:hypothetical protein